MELTFTNERLEDVGLLDYSSADFAFGVDENDFDIVLARESGVPEDGAVIYDESGEVGGVVRGSSTESDSGLLHVVGDTWMGVLDSYVLMPPSGQAYFSVTGAVGQCARQLVARLGLEWLFSVSDRASSTVVSHTFTGNRTDSTQQDSGRYMGGWAALWQLLSDNRCKARFSWDPEAHKVSVIILPRGDRTDAESVAAGAAEVHVSRRKPINHLVCLGQGDLAQRTVVHVYMDERGRIVSSKVLTGMDEIQAVYEDSGAEDQNALRKSGASKLKEYYADSQTVAINVANEDTVYEVGDLIGGTDIATGVQATATVSKKVLRFDGYKTTITYSSTIRS